MRQIIDNYVIHATDIPSAVERFPYKQHEDRKIKIKRMSKKKKTDFTDSRKCAKSPHMRLLE